MAFTVTATTSVTAADATSHAVALPDGSNAAGSVVVVAFLADGNPTVTWPDYGVAGGWTELAAGVTGLTDGRLEVRARRITGDEGFDGTGDTITLTTSVAEESAHNTYLVTAGHHASALPEAAATATPGANDTAPDPPSLSPSWGTEAALWVAVAGVHQATTISAAPTDYTGLVAADSAGTGGVALGSARRELSASSENPGTFTTANSRRWVTTTIAVRPAAAGISATVEPSAFTATATFPAPTLTGVERTVVVPWDDTADGARLSKVNMSVDPPNVSVLDEVDTARRVAVFTNPDGDEPATSGGQRDAWLLTDTAGLGVRHARVPFWGAPQVGSADVGTLLPQHGLILRHQVSGGRRRGVVIDNNVFFGTYWSVLAGVWASDEADAANFSNRQVGLVMGSLVQTATVTASQRTGGIVTLTLAASAEGVFAVGSYAVTNVATASFDGWFLITGVSGNTVTYAQAGVDEAGGSGTLGNTFPYDVEARMPSGSLVEVRAKRHAALSWPSWVSYDSDCGMVFPGGSGNYWSAPPATVGAVTQFSIRAYLTMTDWTPTADQTVIAKYVSSGNQRCFWLRVKAAGTIELLYSPAGSTTGSGTSTVALPATNGQPLAVRADYDSVADTITFYTASTDKGPWSQLGDVRTAAGSAAIFNSTTSPVEIGSALNGTANLLVGRVHGLVMFSDLTETTAIIDTHASVHEDNATSITDRAGVAWTAHGTADLENTAIVAGATAYAADLDQAGTWSSRTTDPTPTSDSGEFGFIVAHLGTDPRSQVSFGPTVASTSLTDFVDATVTPAAFTAPVTLPQASVAVTATPVAFTATTSLPGPSVGASAAPAALTATVAAGQPSVAVAAAPSVATAVAAFPTPTVQAGAGATPDVFTATVDVPAAAVTLGATVTPAPLELAAAFPQATVTLGALVAAQAFTLTVAFLAAAAGEPIVPLDPATVTVTHLAARTTSTVLAPRTTASPLRLL